MVDAAVKYGFKILLNVCISTDIKGFVTSICALILLYIFKIAILCKETLEILEY